MSIETTAYMGLENCIKLSNGTVDIIATTAVGPRILFYGAPGGKEPAWRTPHKLRANGFGQLEALRWSSTLGLARAVSSYIRAGQ